MRINREIRAASVRVIDMEGKQLGVISLADALMAAGLTKSRNEARRIVEQGGVSVNNRKTAADYKISASDLLFGRWLLLRKGKRETCLLHFEADVLA